MPYWLGQSTLNGSGFGTVSISFDIPSLIWIGEQITCNVGPNSTAGTLAVFINNQPVAPAAVLSPMVSPTDLPSVCQTFGGLPYLPIQATDTVEVVVSGASAGDQMTVRMQYREYSLTDPAVDGIIGGAGS